MASVIQMFLIPCLWAFPAPLRSLNFFFPFLSLSSLSKLLLPHGENPHFTMTMCSNCPKKSLLWFCASVTILFFCFCLSFCDSVFFRHHRFVKRRSPFHRRNRKHTRPRARSHLFFSDQDLFCAVPQLPNLDDFFLFCFFVFFLFRLQLQLQSFILVFYSTKPFISIYISYLTHGLWTTTHPQKYRCTVALNLDCCV